MALRQDAVFTMSQVQGVPAAQAPERCREHGCPNLPSITCAYVDSRGRACETQWCSRHVRRIGDHHFCRRHAGTVAALGAKANDPRALPPVNHRGASLVNWICTEGHDILLSAVNSTLREGEVVFEDRTVNVVRNEEGIRQWERGWRIGDRTGISCKITLCVDERDDATVFLKINSQILAQGVPPWITRRRQGETVAPAVDLEDRRQFYGFLQRFIAESLTRR